MNIIVPFSKEVKFEQTLGDVLSISLEHEYNLSNDILLGNFIISGTYKSHELSANKLEFSHTLPFDLCLSEEIDEKTLDFSIDNFTYEVLQGDILKVDIDYLIKAKNLVREEVNLFKEVEVENIFDDKEENILDLINEELELKEEDNNDLITTDEINIFEEVKEEIVTVEEVKEEIVIEETTDDRNQVDEETILNFASENAESFISYKIHLVKEGESVETICKLYSKSENELIEYNLNIPFNPGDKILVPEDDE